LLIVLGGPIGAYETDTYPFLAAEIALLERRLMHDRPTLGICLGSQLMAKALGARVFPGPLKEIGWGRIDLTEAGAGSSLASLGSEDSEVLHWHGDTFDLPAGAVRLACNANYENQAFAFGQAALALQFHAEADPGSLEKWYGSAMPSSYPPPEYRFRICGLPPLALPAGLRYRQSGFSTIG
jgi:GMP synthase (glutamine-hydrolysing)